MSAARRGEPGLYAADYEHDACGVAFVARLDAQPLHETVRRALEALENLEHRGAAGADPGTGDGAGILMQIPDAFFRAVVGDALPARGSYGVAVCFLPHEPGRRQELEARLAAIVAEEGQEVVCWRDVPVDPAYVGRTAGAVGAARPPARRRRGRRGRRRPGCLRAQALRDSPPLRARGRRRRDRAELLVAHDRLQGDAHRPAAPRLLPGPAGRAHRDRARPRPFAVLDEHLPELGARPPVPDDRPQRRDQHGPRQRQLDARPRVAARVGAVRRRPPQGAAGRAGGRLRLGDVRQRPRAARARRPLAAARDDDDDPRGDARAGPTSRPSCSGSTPTTSA